MKQGVQQLEAIVMRMVDYGESDRIITLLTPNHGRISSFAAHSRKSKRRFNGGLDLFSHLSATVYPPKSSQSHLWRMSKVELINPHFELRKDLKRLAIASYLAEGLVMLGGEGDPQPLLFSWWKTTLAKLSDPLDMFGADFRYDLELFALCGFAPRWNSCTVCSKKPQGERLFFSYQRGGIVCQNCRSSEDGVWFDHDVVKALASGKEVQMAFRSELRKTLDGFMTHTLGREPKSQRFRSEVLSGC